MEAFAEHDSFFHGLCGTFSRKEAPKIIHFHGNMIVLIVRTIGTIFALHLIEYMISYNRSINQSVIHPEKQRINIVRAI